MTNPHTSFASPPGTTGAELLLRAKKLLEAHGYVVARIPIGEWKKHAFHLGDRYIAFHLNSSWSLEHMDTVFVKPKDFCKIIGISRKTLTKRLREKDCPKIRQQRGPKGRLRTLQPTQELVLFLRRNKGS